MRQRFYKIIVVAFLALGNQALAQEEPLVITRDTGAQHQSPTRQSASWPPHFRPNNFLKKDSVSLLKKSLIIQSNHYTSNFAFFCKQEWMFEKNTSVPLRFRLGSLNYVDGLEGKKQ